MTTALRPPETAQLPPLGKDWAVRTWVGASFVSFAGDSVFLIAFAWAAVHEASPALAGLLIGIGMLPQALVMLFGGAIADRYDTRRIVLLGNSTRVVILVAGSLAWQAGAPRIPVMLAVAVAFGITDALYNPANSTLPRQMVRPDDLGAVAGMFQVSRRLAVLAGAAIGGWVAGAFGLGVAMLVDAVTFAVVGAAIWAVVRPRFTRPKSAATTMVRGILEGVSYVGRSELARTFVLATSGLNLFIGPALAVGVALRVSESHWGAGALGLVEACVGAGAALGAAATIRWRPQRDALWGFGALLPQGVAIGLLGVPHLGAVVTAASVIGLTAGAASVLIAGALQRTLDPAYLGRTSSMIQLGDLSLMPVMMPLLGWLAHVTSVTLACGVFGLGMVLLSAWGTSRRPLRGLRRDDPVMSISADPAPVR